VSRYKTEQLRVSGPVRGFLIHTPSGKTIRDLYPQTLVRELNRLNDHIKRIENAIRKTLNKNRHLADGDDCTLIDLKKALPEWK
jgi:hypothetical protein